MGQIRERILKRIKKNELAISRFRLLLGKDKDLNHAAHREITILQNKIDKDKKKLL